MKYDIILADPPWEYKNSRNHDPAQGGITYPTLPLEDIKALPVYNLASKNCALFLWATLPQLREGLITMKAWGFKYVTTAFVWVKLNPTGSLFYDGKDVTLKGGAYSGLGHWTNSNVEVVLFGKRGSPKRKNKNVKQIIFAPRESHSKKPEEIYSRIESLMYGDNKIELFATSKYPGWDSIGYEVDGRDIREVLCQR